MAESAGRPRVEALIYRAHYGSGNTDFAHALPDAIDARGASGADLRRFPAHPSAELVAELGNWTRWW